MPNHRRPKQTLPIQPKLKERGLRPTWTSLDPQLNTLGAHQQNPLLKISAMKIKERFHPIFKTLGWGSMGSKLVVRDKGCSLIMTVMKWRYGMRATTCEPPHGQANKGMGAAKSFISWIWLFEEELAADIIVDVTTTIAPEITAPNPRCVHHFQSLVAFRYWTSSWNKYQLSSHNKSSTTTM